MSVTRYRCKHAVEAMRWTDTDENREVFAGWFESHDVIFETRGPVVMMPEHRGEAGDEAGEGEWILYMDGEFIAMDAETFAETYEPVVEPARNFACHHGVLRGDERSACFYELRDAPEGA